MPTIGNSWRDRREKKIRKVRIEKMRGVPLLSVILPVVK